MRLKQAYRYNLHYPTDRVIHVTDPPYNADPTGVLDSTVGIQTALDTGESVHFPAGTYKITDSLSLSTTTFDYIISGDGMGQSVINAVGLTGKPAFKKADAGQYFRAVLKDFGVTGDADTCIDLDGTGVFFAFQCVFENLFLVSVADDAFKSNLEFSCTWRNVHVSSTSGHGFRLQGGNTTLLERCYAHNVPGVGKAGYRIYSGATLIDCNGVDSGETWGHFGANTAEGDPVNGLYQISLIGCNIEAYTVTGLNLRFNGWLNTDNCNFTKPSTGTIQEHIRVAYCDQAISLRNTRIEPSGATLTSAADIYAEGAANILDMTGDFDGVFILGLPSVLPLPSMESERIDSTVNALKIPYLSSVNVKPASTWTADLATFSVAGIDKVLTANTGATTLTNATGGLGSQELTILVKDANTTIGHAKTGTGQFLLIKGSDYTASSGDAIKFIYDSGNWREYQQTLQEEFIMPNDIYDNNGAAAVTPVSDIQVPFDGNFLTWDEVTGAPGMDLSVNFTNVTTVRGVVLRAYYEGSSSHQVNVSLYNYSTATDDIIIRLDDAANPDFNYRTILIPDGSDYISSGASQINFIHPITGNNTHDLFIDYVAIVT